MSMNERVNWNKTHTREAVRIINEWLVDCKTRSIINLYPYQRVALEWTLEEMGFNRRTIVWDIVDRELRPILELVGGREEKKKFTFIQTSEPVLVWIVGDRRVEFHVALDDDSLTQYYEIEKVQRFLSGCRILKTNKKMWKVQMELFSLKARLKDLYKKGCMPCYSVLTIGTQLALLKLPDYKIAGWFNYSLDGVKELEAATLVRA